MRRIGFVRVWSAHIGNERLVEQAEKYGFQVGCELEASWDAERGMIVGTKGAAGDG